MKVDKIRKRQLKLREAISHGKTVTDRIWGAVYHVTARGNERGKVFFSKKDYENFKEYLAEAREKHGFVLHCYVLMTNHLIMG